MTPTASGVDLAVRALVEARNRDPFAVLGPHREGRDVVVRTLQPAARAVDVRLRATGELRAMTRCDPTGLYELRLTDAPDETPDYRLRMTFAGNHVTEVDDPYRYGRVLSDFDLHLF